MTSISDTNVVNAPGGLVELGFSRSTTSYNLTTSSAAIMPTITIVSDGSPLLIEYFSPTCYSDTATVQGLIGFSLDGAAQENNGFFATPSNGVFRTPFYIQRRWEPAAGVHTITVMGSKNLASGTLGLAGDAHGMYLRVSKIIQASQLIVQTPNAPLVTSLPSNAIDGQEVRYLADNTNGIVWNFRYRAGSSSTHKWEFIGGQPLYSFIAAWEGTTTNYPNYTNLATSGPSLSVPLAGQYMVDLSYISQETNGGYSTTIVTQSTGAPLDVANALFQIDATTADVQTSFTSRALTLTTTNPLRVLYARNGTGTANFGQRHLRFTPIRVSA